MGVDNLEELGASEPEELIVETDGDAPDPAAVTLFEEDDDPLANVGEEVPDES